MLELKGPVKSIIPICLNSTDVRQRHINGLTEAGLGKYRARPRRILLR